MTLLPEKIKELNDFTEKFKKGDKNAFGFLLNKYKEEMIYFVEKIVRNHEDALDIMQKASKNAYNHHSTLNGNSFYKWFKKILYNESINFLKKKETKKHRKIIFIKDDFVDSKSYSLKYEYENKENVQKILKSKIWSRKERCLLKIFYEEPNLTCKELALKIGGKTTEKSVSVMWYKIRKKSKHLKNFE